MLLSIASKRRLLINILLIVLAGIYHMYFDNALPIIEFTTLLYIVIDFNWAVYLYKRITQKNILKPLLSISILILIWFILQQCKFNLFSVNDSFCRYLWYLYYIPMLFIPLMGYYASVGIGTLEKKTSDRLLVIPTAVIAIGILTNDFHQQAFYFNQNFYDWDRTYSHHWLYFAVVFWIAFLMIATTKNMLKKSEFMDNKLSLLILIFPVIICGSYMLWLFFNVGAAKKPYELTEAFCIMVMSFWEACIVIGLVPANNNYTRLFKISTLSAQIVDKSGNVIHSTANAIRTTRNQRLNAINDGILIDENHRLDAHEIFGGYIFWTSDIANINNLNEQLKEQMEVLAGENQMLSAEVSLKHRQIAADTKNAIYDTIAKNLKEKLNELERNMMIARENSDAERYKMAICCIIIVYIKRYSNLMLIGEMDKSIHLLELVYSIRESLDYVKLTNLETKYVLFGSGEFSLQNILKAFDAYNDFIRDIYVEYGQNQIGGKLLVDMKCDGELLNIDFRYKNQEDFRESNFSCHTAGYLEKEGQ